MIIFKKEFFEQIVKQCKQEYLNEACGILAGKDGNVEKIYEMINVEKSPSFFSMSPEE